MTDETEKLRLIEDLGRTLLRATEALEAANWQDCERACYSAARQARMILLEERQREREKGD